MVHLKKKNEKLERVILERTSTLNNTVDELQQVKSKLEQETTQQKKLIGTISHDITTPIKYLSMTTEMLSESSDDDIRLKKEYLKAIHQSTTELYNFTQTLKEYAEIYNQEKSFETNNYLLNDIIENKIMLFSGIASSKNIQIKNNISNQVDVNFGKNILAVIIHNLLDNAIKNSNDGTIEFDYYEDKGLKIIQITDEGNGMSKQNINYYHNLQHSIQNDKLLLQNKGLGLHLIIQFLQMLEAKIHIQENKPKGSIMKLIFK